MEPTSLDRTIVPLILMNFILGMGHFDYSVNRARRIVSFVYSVICAAVFLIITKASMEHTYMSRTLDEFTFLTLFYVNICISICLIVIGWIKSKNLQAIVARMGICDRTMEKMGLPKSYRMLFLYQVYSFTFVGVSTVMAVVVNYNWLISNDGEFHAKIKLMIATHLPILLIGVFDATFCFWVRYTRLKFHQLNNLLRGLLTTTPDSPQHKRVLAMKYDLIGKDFPMHEYDSPRRGNDNADTIKAVKQIHLELVKSARNANDMYGIQILLTMTASFVLVTGLLYDAYKIIWVDTSDYNFIHKILPVSTWIFLYAFKIFFVNHACARANAEASDIGDIICELYEPSTSKEFRAEIRDFTLQLIQNPLTFTACGFFDLDHTFIQGVIGSITTYLVILIQVGEIGQPEEVSNSTEATINVTGNSNTSVELFSDNLF